MTARTNAQTVDERLREVVDMICDKSLGLNTSTLILVNELAARGLALVGAKPASTRRVEAIGAELKAQGYGNLDQRNYIATRIIAADPLTAVAAQMREALDRFVHTDNCAWLYDLTCDCGCQQAMQAKAAYDLLVQPGDKEGV